MPVICTNKSKNACHCHHQIQNRVNVYNCSFTALDHLLASVPPLTEWTIMESNNIKFVHEYYSYMNAIEFLDLKHNALFMISDSFLFNMSRSKSLKWLDLSNNKFQKIPEKLQILRNLDKLWISGNPIYCDCSMTWMIGWLANFTTSSGDHVVVDYYDVKCHYGMMVGSQVYALDKVSMGCLRCNFLWKQKDQPSEESRG